jgi:hypothetical protein
VRQVRLAERCFHVFGLRECDLAHDEWKFYCAAVLTGVFWTVTV